MAVNTRAERLLGFQSYSCVRSSYYITDEFDFQLNRYLGGFKALRPILIILAFAATLVFATQVHAYLDGGLLPSFKKRKFNCLELFFYKLGRIKLILWTYGADVRTRNRTLALGDPSCCSLCTKVGTACICLEALGKNYYYNTSRHATAVFSMGDMKEYTPRSRNDLFYWPVDLDSDGGIKYAPSYPSLNSLKAMRIVHAPNHREFKGTQYLEEAVRQLQAEGLPIELILVEGLPNHEALRVYKTADIVFDQCLIGFHGYFALEAMALGKPVMCFIRKPHEYLLAPQECPIINTTASTIKEDLKKILENKENLEKIGKKGRKYIEKYYTMEAFARRLRIAYRDLGLIS